MAKTKTKRVQDLEDKLKVSEAVNFILKHPEYAKEIGYKLKYIGLKKLNHIE